MVEMNKALNKERLFPWPMEQMIQKKSAMIDVLARIPYEYPRVGNKDDPTRYVVLLVPTGRSLRDFSGCIAEPAAMISLNQLVNAGLGYRLPWGLEDFLENSLTCIQGWFARI